MKRTTKTIVRSATISGGGSPGEARKESPHLRVRVEDVGAAAHERPLEPALLPARPGVPDARELPEHDLRPTGARAVHVPGRGLPRVGRAGRSDERHSD